MIHIDINLLECMVDVMKFGKMDLENYNVDLIIFTHPRYWYEEDRKSFICFQINNN